MLSALATMRMDGRENAVAGSAQLSQLSERDPSLLARPECQLAYGIAQSNLHSTTDAIQKLRAAATHSSNADSASAARKPVCIWHGPGRGIPSGN